MWNRTLSCVQGATPLSVASAAGLNDVVRVLLGAGADINAVDKVGFLQ